MISLCRMHCQKKNPRTQRVESTRKCVIIILKFDSPSKYMHVLNRYDHYISVLIRSNLYFNIFINMVSFLNQVRFDLTS